MATIPERIEQFTAWLDSEMQLRGLTDAALAKRGGFSKSVISKARAGNIPGWEACKSIAAGLNLPAEIVLRAAGHLPQIPQPDQQQQELDHLYRQAMPEIRRNILGYLRYLVENSKK